MPDLTPPPEQDLPAASRARLRADLALATIEPARRRGWLAPLAAAAVVAVLAGGVALVAGHDGPTPVAGPAAGPGATPASTPVPLITPQQTALPVPMPHVLSSSGDRLLARGNVLKNEFLVLPKGHRGPGLLLGPQKVGTCATEVPDQLPGAHRDSSIAGHQGDTEFWVKGDRWILCDENQWVVTLHSAARLDASSLPLGFSTDTLTSGARDTVNFVAGGPLPSSLRSVEYVFPDGHRETAGIVSGPIGRWWRMEYTATSGVLADPATNSDRLGPVQVIVTSTSGHTTTTALPFAANQCAQVNHGC